VEGSDSAVLEENVVDLDWRESESESERENGVALD